MIPGVEGIMTQKAIDQTADTIAALQLPSGQIPWFEGGHADPWNHVEAAMALALADRILEAERAFDWLARTQHADGSWFNYYVGDDIEDARLDTNVVAYVATGVWHHYLHTRDAGFLAQMWPVVERALEFVLDLQQDSGEILWSREPDGSPGSFALLTGSSSIYFSLRCAIAAAEHQGLERPDWELAAGRLRHAVAFRPESFQPKHRWAMDWYYPILCGALGGRAGEARLEERWGDFVMDGVGVRCVSDQPWVTAAETTECVMALDAVGRRGDALMLFEWAQRLRHEDGAYWTGWVHPEEIHFPGGERTSYTSAAVILAANALGGSEPTSGLFRGEGLPSGLDLSEPVEPRSKRR